MRSAVSRDCDILVIGAAGQMTSVTVLALCRALPQLRVTLADRDVDAVARLAERVSPARVARATFDLYDASALARAVARAAVTVNGAGPYHRTAAPVMRACIAAGTHYFDIDDDVESTLQALDLDAAARAAGVTLYVGHGASPGFTNVLARDVLSRLDAAHEVEVAWCVGEQRGAVLGRAVAEHTMHIGAGDFVGWFDGGRGTRPSFAADAIFPLAPPLGDYRLYECAHPEPVMLGHTFPQLRRAVCWGGLHPAPLNGIVRGLAGAVRAGRLSMDEACDFLQSVSAGGPGTWRGWRQALSGVWRQWHEGHIAGADVLRYAASTLRGGGPPPASGIGARARGLRAGRACAVVARVRTEGADGTDAMAALTGLSAATFFQLSRQLPAPAGVAFPEMWVDPARFYATLNAHLRELGAALAVEVTTEAAGSAAAAGRDREPS